MGLCSQYHGHLPIRCNLCDRAASRRRGVNRAARIDSQSTQVGRMTLRCVWRKLPVAILHRNRMNDVETVPFVVIFKTALGQATYSESSGPNASPLMPPSFSVCS